MKGFIDGFNFGEMEAMKYYAPPASWDDERKKTNVKDKIFGKNFLGAKKMDGFFAKLIKDEDGTVLLYSRSRNVNGEFVDKHEWVPQLNDFFDWLPNGSCVLGELYFPNKPGSRNVTTILGCLLNKAIERQNLGEKLHFYVFDMLAWEGANMIDEKAQKRFAAVEAIAFKSPFVEIAHYVSNENLWSELQSYLADGGEGFVITDPNAKYEPGKRPSKTTLKVKQELKETIDCVIMGANPPTKLYNGKQIETWMYWQNRMTGEKIEGDFYADFYNGKPLDPVTRPYFFGWAGSLNIGLYDEKEKKLKEIGSISGLTNEVLENWRDYVGKVVEVTAMEVFDDTKGLRHPKVLGWREDKKAIDCTLSQIQ